MLNNFGELEKQYIQKVSSIVAYGGGGLTYEDAWMLSPTQFKIMDDTINEKMDLMIKMGKASLF